MSKFQEVIRLPEFDRAIKKLLHRFSTLESDLEEFINTELVLFHKLDIDNKGIFRISDLGFEYPLVFKVKKFACRSLKGKGVMSGIRIVYAYFSDSDRIEFIEIFFKGDRENEDRKQIRRLYKLKNEI